jgi:hypothetical protein
MLSNAGLFRRMGRAQDMLARAAMPVTAARDMADGAAHGATRLVALHAGCGARLTRRLADEPGGRVLALALALARN